MPEGIVDDGQFADTGHESGRRQSARERPADVPLSWVFDRKSKEWREPRKPGPRAADDVAGDADDDMGDGGGWRADRDPAAAHLRDERSAAPEIELNAEIRDDVAGLLALLAIPVGSLAERRDPYCGAVFADSLPEIVRAATPIVCRSQTVLRWMTADTGGLMDWIGLARALSPVAMAVVQHHVIKTVRVADEPGYGPVIDEASEAAAA